MTTNADRPAQFHNQERQNQQPRAEQLRERMNGYSGRGLSNPQNHEQNRAQNANTQARSERQSQPRTERQSADNRTAEGSNPRPQIQPGASENRRSESRVNSDPTNRVERTTTAREQQPSRVDRTASPRVQQQSRVERTEQPRVQQQNRTVARTERPSTQWNERPITTEPAQQVDRSQVQHESREVARVERAERSERTERTSGGGSRNSGDRTEMRGGRER
jgi:hypothetical protein